jgi:Transcriptional regulator, AbiEi antitoxin
MNPQNRTVEELIGRMATRQHGVVTWSQLLEAGISKEEVKGRVRSRALLRVHRGVYRVGHSAPSVEARYLAAVFACGEGARLAGLAAGHL